ncbi:hypothetical protein EJ06DRAFT_555752 [Trichodelitschia bisporula]|uniref:SH3 domain-containing protein n=1 Tax=Trichodelitschia bisporula TaxID=703511 RepID=A0A6G1HYZ1_9PEZI|nr:hypothetical protein EJ06DRAFT_555752 [Trichodelitschia bisporula]
MAQQCIPLKNSASCPAFNQSSISTNADLSGRFPFLQYVSDVESFDRQFKQYIATSYSQQKYKNLLSCTNVNLTNTTNLYARYTTTVLCNAMVQLSINVCQQSARPLCAETCAEFATSEEQIASSELCKSSGNDAVANIRSDFVTCSLPENSLSGNCIHGVANEPGNCGFADNLPSLCSYCAASSPNSTDSCCVNSRTESRCTGVKLPITTSMGNIFPSGTPTSTGTPLPAAAHKSGLHAGAIAGIVIGSLLGAALVLGAIIFFCMRARKNQQQHSSAGSLNSATPPRHGQPAMSHAGSTRQTVPPDTLLPGARVHQMVALESSDGSAEGLSSPIGGAYGHSSSFSGTPDSQRSGLGVTLPPKRAGSLSNHSHDDGSSPRTGEEYSSPEGMASGHSEEMSHFKDYYSSDEIRPGDVVAVLWAYQPRAGDEWELERGDMLKVVGIWDDGWATGIKVREKAEEWEARRRDNRDSGVSNGGDGEGRLGGPTGEAGDIKAFPLVCVCLPQHWRKTIDGDTLEPAASP